MDSRALSMTRCLYESLSNEGFLALWKGLAAPLAGAIPLNTMVFVITDMTKDALEKRSPQMSGANQAMLAGMVAGVFSLSIFVPGDLFKCRAQMTKDGKLDYR